VTWPASIDDAVLGAASIASGVRRLPAWRIPQTCWWCSGEVIVAIAGLTDSVRASNNDVCGLRCASTESGAIRKACWTGEDSSGRVVCDWALGRDEGGRSGEEND
jgi:hypothetical protein